MYVTLTAIVLVLLFCAGVCWYMCTDVNVDLRYLNLLKTAAETATSVKRLRRIERRLARYVISKYTHRLEHHAAEVRAAIHRRKVALTLKEMKKWAGSE